MDYGNTLIPNCVFIEVLLLSSSSSCSGKSIEKDRIWGGVGLRGFGGGLCIFISVLPLFFDSEWLAGLLTLRIEVYSLLFDTMVTLIPLGISVVYKLGIRERIVMIVLASLGCLVTASAVIEVIMVDHLSGGSLLESYKAAIFANIELHIGMIALNTAYCYYPRQRRITTNKHNSLNQYGCSLRSDFKNYSLDDVSSETKINKTSSSIYTPATVHTADTQSTMSGHDNTQTRILKSPLSPLSLLKLFLQRNQSSSSVQDIHDDTDIYTLKVYEEETESIPLKDTIQKITEYAVVSTRLSESSVYLPGNGNWFISGKVPV
ncbi:hypothetical protein TSTA_059290 [Talaromyces stipitatus ATCC 10500]|uniref:Uncharacterized protein n=1 Tax=Talaromyces stipitatus (strain ATCC 10500 / CBS 375.48 / QM 6759 / NRRL 1006) TaxID=441959 RepID=B8MQM0_TALSN|nr:uncharacterized protein TSTA_059290 [Talaromyces stipitatus ATCC 10500]EED13443.1 hypothetical protein TSTA_059290 [Talaromyces stipitatus ATCC 10500]